MRILVTGIDGYIGTRLAPLLMAGGHNVVGFGRRRGHDITDAQQVKKAAAEADWIVHLAGLVGIGVCERDPDKAWRVNVEGTQNVMLCHKRVLYASVLASYEDRGLIDESTPAFPRAVYFKTKLEAEKLVLQEGQMAVRLGTLYGVNEQAMRDDLLVHSFCREAVQKGKITVFQPECMRPLTYVDEAATAIKFLVEKADVERGIFNVVTQNCRKGSVAAIVSDCTGSPIVPVAGIDDEGRDYSASTEKLKATGFVFSAPRLEGAVRDICAWYKSKANP
jgi:dTDP-4-dehydrorhamnose reductase